MERPTFTPTTLEQVEAALATWQEVQFLAAVSAEISRRKGDTGGVEMAEWFEQRAGSEAVKLESRLQDIHRLRSLTDEQLDTECRRWHAAEAMVERG